MVKDNNGKLLRQYVYDPKNNLIAVIKDSVRYSVIRDSHNNLAALTDESSNIVEKFTYDVWGNIIDSQTIDNLPSELTDFYFASYYYEATAKLYILGPRAYDPELGRFLSKDPLPGEINDRLSQNEYIYAVNDPVNKIDPTGHRATSVNVSGSAKAIADAAKKTVAEITLLLQEAQYLVDEIKVAYEDAQAKAQYYTEQKVQALALVAEAQDDDAKNIELANVQAVEDALSDAVVTVAFEEIRYEAAQVAYNGALEARATAEEIVQSNSAEIQRLEIEIVARAQQQAIAVKSAEEALLMVTTPSTTSALEDGVIITPVNQPQIATSTDIAPDTTSTPISFLGKTYKIFAVWTDRIFELTTAHALAKTKSSSPSKSAPAPKSTPKSASTKSSIGFFTVTKMPTIVAKPTQSQAQATKKIITVANLVNTNKINFTISQVTSNLQKAITVTKLAPKPIATVYKPIIQARASKLVVPTSKNALFLPPKLTPKLVPKPVASSIIFKVSSAAKQITKTNLAQAATIKVSPTAPQNRKDEKALNYVIGSKSITFVKPATPSLGANIKDVVSKAWTNIKTPASVAVSLFPFVGEGYDILTLIAQKDPITGEKLNQFTTVLTVAGLMSGVGSGSAARKLGNIALEKLAKELGVHIDEILPIAGDIAKQYKISSIDDLKALKGKLSLDDFVGKVKEAVKTKKILEKINWSVSKTGVKISGITIRDLSFTAKNASKDLGSVGYNAEKYEKLGYHPKGSGKIYYNNENYLPELPNGYGYREWDTFKTTDGTKRGVERFVTAHDSQGKLLGTYYTNTHFGDLKTGPAFFLVQ
jgi:RHS repeat-associated protein